MVLVGYDFDQVSDGGKCEFGEEMAEHVPAFKKTGRTKGAES